MKKEPSQSGPVLDHVVVTVPALPDDNYGWHLRRMFEIFNPSAPLCKTLWDLGWDLVTMATLDNRHCQLQPGVLYDLTKARTIRVYFGKERTFHDPVQAPRMIPPGTEIIEPVAALFACAEVIKQGGHFSILHTWTCGLRYSPDGNGKFTHVFRLDIEPPHPGRARGVITLDWNVCDASSARVHYGTGYGEFLD